MIETRVRIVATAAGKALVAPTEQSGCGACQASGSCGIGGISRLLKLGRRPVALACGGELRPGDEWLVAVSEAELVKAGLLAYILPVVLAVAGAGLATLKGHGDAGAALGMLCGAATGLLAARLLGRAPRLRMRRPEQTTHSQHSTRQGEAP